MHKLICNIIEKLKAMHMYFGSLECDNWTNVSSLFSAQQCLHTVLLEMPVIRGTNLHQVHRII